LAGQDEAERLYASVGNWKDTDGYSAQEKLAIEFAERFCVSHDSLDDDFFERLRAEFSEEEILDLVTCCSMFLGLGRMLSVLGIEEEEPVRI
jgi:alkylhydroperoxidase family enzyme